MTMLRHRSPIKAEYEVMSSPDPLVSSSQDNSTRYSSPSRHEKMSVAQNRRTTTDSIQSDCVDFLHSPSRTVTEQTISPWRIRVTVEAEHEGSAVEGGQNIGKLQTFTTTTKIPLREDDSLRQSTNTKHAQPLSNAKQRRRSETPHGDEERSRRQSVTDLDIVVLGDDDDENEWTAEKWSPKKSRRKNSKARTNKSRRKSKDDGFEIREDDHSQSPSQNDGYNLPSKSPELRQIDLNRVSVRSRADSIKYKQDIGCDESGNHERADMLNVKFNNRKVSANSAMTYPTPSPTVSEHGNSDNHKQGFDEHDDRFDTIMESEGFTMIDLDSLPSIKNIRSSPAEQETTKAVPKNRENSFSPQSTRSRFAIEESHSRKQPSSAARLASNSSSLSDLPSSPPSVKVNKQPTSKTYLVGHLQIPSSTHIYRHRQITPQPYSSPKLPSPPRQSASKIRWSPNSSQALYAGQVLQEALVPHETHAPLEDNSSIDHESDGADAAFKGFSAGTCRELRAGLRFGEELAKKQAAQPMAAQKSSESMKPGSRGEQIWRGEHVVQRTPIPAVPQHVLSQHITTETGSDQKSDSSPYEASRQNSESHTPRALVTVEDNTAILNTQVRWQREWQREREEVIRQVNQASETQVIVIDDDSDQEVYGNVTPEDQNDGEVVAVGDETDGDIWLAEAKNSSSPQAESVYPDPVQIQHEHAGLTTEHLRRQLIPSPWKRGQLIPDHESNSTMLPDDTSISGFIWRDPGRREMDHRFGADIVAKPDKLYTESGFIARSRDVKANVGQPTNRRVDTSSDPGLAIDEESAAQEDILVWRNAEDVVDEESAEAEVSGDEQPSSPSTNHDETSPMHLQESSLQSVPEQDLCSTLQVQQQHHRKIPVESDDSEVPSELSSDQLTPQIYNQRISLSPSKERPITPRSAFKGNRMSIGQKLQFFPVDDVEASKRVVFAKRSSCMNDEWEESSRSVRSHVEDDELRKAAEEEEQDHIEQPEIKASSKQLDVGNDSEQHPQPVKVKGWLGWLRQDSAEQFDEQQRNTHSSYGTRQHPTSIYDGTNESSELTSAPYVPTSRHAPTTRECSVAPKTPSYLFPPSYPSDPTRSPSIPLQTRGSFTNTHFRTLHIIYRKSLRSRFHAPKFDECRTSIQSLVFTKWSMKVDEGKKLGETFEFRTGELEARILERFCREVEWGYVQNGKVSEMNDVKWGWKMEQLASWLGRIVVGEVVRSEEYTA